MPFVLVDKEQAEQNGIRHTYEDIEAGIYSEDGVYVIIRPLTQLEQRRFEDQVSDLFDENKSVRPSTINRKRTKVFDDRIKNCVIGWGGIKNSDGEEIPFSHDALKLAFEQNPGFHRFVFNAMLDPYREVRKIQDAEKN